MNFPNFPYFNAYGRATGIPTATGGLSGRPAPARMDSLTTSRRKIAKKTAPCGHGSESARSGISKLPSRDHRERLTCGNFAPETN